MIITWEILKQLQLGLPYNPALLLLSTTRKRTETCMSEDLSLYMRGNIVHTMKLGNYSNAHQFDEQKAADGIFM